MNSVSRLGTIVLAAVTAVGCADAPRAPAPQEPTPERSCAPAEPFEKDIFNADGYQWRVTFSPDGSLALWARGATFFPISRKAEIVFARRTAGGWTKPQVVPFSGVGSNIDPSFTPDGSAVLFSSIRGGRGDADLWLVRRSGDGWEEPVNLGPQVNSEADELYPSVDESGNLYFGSDRGSGDWDIWRAARGPDGRFGAAERLGGNINRAQGWEFNPDVSPDGKRLVFAAHGREGGAGAGDIYVAELPDGQPRPVSSCVNTGADEYHPTGLWKSNELIFVRSGDFYKAAL